MNGNQPSDVPLRAIVLPGANGNKRPRAVAQDFGPRSTSHVSRPSDAALPIADVRWPALQDVRPLPIQFGLRADAETATIPLIFLTAKAEKLDICAGMNLGADDCQN